MNTTADEWDTLTASLECALLSENALAEDWLNEAEEEAWREFQKRSTKR